MIMGDGEVDIYAGLSPARNQSHDAQLCNGGKDDRLKMPLPPLPHDESSTSSTFDLYSDLIEEEENKPKEVVAKLEEENVENQGKISQLASKIEGLQKENESLQDQNAALKKNISALLKTAKLEMKRKDWELMQLKLRSKSDFKHHFADRPPPAPADPDRGRGNHHTNKVNPNLIPLGKQRQFESATTSQRQPSHSASGRRDSPDTEISLKSRQELLKESSRTPPSKRIPRGPHTPPGEPPPSGSSAENSPIATRLPSEKSRSRSPIHNFKRPLLYERTNHDRSTHNAKNSKAVEHDKSDNGKHDRSAADVNRNRQKKRKRSDDEDRRSSSRSTRRRDTRQSEKSRDDKYRDHEKVLDRERESSRRRRAKSVQKAKEALYMSMLSPAKGGSTRDKYDQLRRSRAVSKERELGRSSRAISRDRSTRAMSRGRELVPTKSLSSRDKEKRSDRKRG
ncbi:uncharacterized protein [Amphiura filiformis]|uniref:uncharacterized protein n=1 Tax=Amphiura filiformis TaxID=82378 RepID=UPI003B21F556